MEILFGESIHLYVGNLFRDRHVPENAHFKMYLTEHVQFKIIIQNDWHSLGHAHIKVI